MTLHYNINDWRRPPSLTTQEPSDAPHTKWQHPLGLTTQEPSDAPHTKWRRPPGLTTQEPGDAPLTTFLTTKTTQKVYSQGHPSSRVGGGGGYCVHNPTRMLAPRLCVPDWQLNSKWRFPIGRQLTAFSLRPKPVIFCSFEIWVSQKIQV